MAELVQLNEDLFAFVNDLKALMDKYGVSIFMRPDDASGCSDCGFYVAAADGEITELLIQEIDVI